MSIENQSITAVRRSTTHEAFSDLLGMASGILLLFLINLVAIAAFLATAAQAIAGTPATTVSAFVSPAADVGLVGSARSGGPTISR